MSNCCSCIRDCTADTYQPLSSQRFGCSRGKVQRDGREAVRSPRNQRRKLSVRYDAVRPARAARLDNVRFNDRCGDCTIANLLGLGLAISRKLTWKYLKYFFVLLKILFIINARQIVTLALREKDFDPCF